MGQVKGRAAPRYRRVGLTTSRCGWSQMSIVCGGGEFGWSRGLSSESGCLSHGQASRLGNQPDGVMSSLGGRETGLTLSVSLLF